MTGEILYKSCPRCGQGTVARRGETGTYSCDRCGLALEERALLGLFRKGRYAVTGLGEGRYELAWAGLQKVVLPPEPLKVVIGNVYTDPDLAAIAGGELERLRPVQTIVAQIILEQLHETCHLQVNGLSRGHGAPLSASDYRPEQPVPRQGMDWQDRGNLFCTDQRLVFPSDSFTFIRLDRKLAAVRAFTNGLAVQRQGEEFATYFAGCYAHEAALAAAYVLGKLPALRPSSLSNSVTKAAA